MTFANKWHALRAARRFHKHYGSKGNVYRCKPAIFATLSTGVVVEVWVRGHSGTLYFSTLI